MLPRIPEENFPLTYRTVLLTTRLMTIPVIGFNIRFEESSSVLLSDSRQRRTRSECGGNIEVDLQIFQICNRRQRQQFEPTAKRAAAKPSRPIKDIIRPFPNISSWRFRRHFWLVPNQNSQAAMQKFLHGQGQGSQLHTKIDNELAEASLPWEDAAHGWRKTSISIDIPTGEKRSKSSRRNRRTTCEDADSEDDAPDTGSGSTRKSLV